MAVTVKTVKKKKPLALKKSGAPAAAPAEGDAAPGADGAPAAAPVAAAAPGKKKAAAPVKKVSYTFAGVCAILVFLMFSAILTLQILEWKHYDAPPKAAFPPFGIKPGQIPIAGSYSAAPAADVEVAGGDEFDNGGDFLDGEEDVPVDDVTDEGAIPVE